jgi:hypothetical protein
MAQINKNFKNKGKDIKYLNKDFDAFRNNLIEFAKTYFPKTYTDFSDASPGMMFIEMASYVGDSLSYYVDDTLKESLLYYAEDKANVLAMAQMLGYKPKVSVPAVTTISVYQLVPSVGVGVNNQPDSRSYLKIKEGMLLRSNQNVDVTFRTTDIVDFSEDIDREITPYQRDSTTGEVSFYLVKKKVQAINADVFSANFNFGTYSPYATIDLLETNIVSIYDVRDSNGNKYYEVPYLAQEMVYVDFPNTEENDSELYQFKDTVPYLLKLLKTPKRFATYINQNNTTRLQFGAADANANDELLIPTFKNVGLGLPNSIDRLGASYDPTNFLKTKSYGVSPSNTTINVKYLVGGGVIGNVAKGVLTEVIGVEYDNNLNGLTNTEISLLLAAQSSLAVDNEVPASGGRDAETLEEIRQNALATFGSQNRAVTAKDYQVRTLAMPAKFGAVAKAYATSDGTLENNSPESILASPNTLQEFTDLVMDFINLPDNQEPNEQTVQEKLKEFLTGKTSNKNEVNNPFAINLYLLGYDENGKLTSLNRAVKENLKRYLNEYRILTDGINISDGFVINFGIDFEIVCYSNYNKTEVVTRCINDLTDYFNTDNWQFNQTINLSEIELLLANVDGVASVSYLDVYNKCGGIYSPNSYDMKGAMKNKIIYPSLDPSVFELKFPTADIKGKAK